MWSTGWIREANETHDADEVLVCPRVRRTALRGVTLDEKIKNLVPLMANEHDPNAKTQVHTFVRTEQDKSLVKDMGTFLKQQRNRLEKQLEASKQVQVQASKQVQAKKPVQASKQGQAKKKQPRTVNRSRPRNRA